MEAFQDVIIVVHLMVIVALIGVVLLQRSEGGALGIGGSSNFLTGRGNGNVLTRATGILAAAFFATSIAMTVLSRLASPPSELLNTLPQVTAPAAPATPATEGTATAPAAGETTTPATGGSGGILNQLNTYVGGTPGASGSSTTAPPATDSGTTAPAQPAPTAP
jgi:preprotein translocase subunit SecG